MANGRATPKKPKAQVLDLDLSTLTVADIEAIEEIIDAPFDEAFKPGARKGKVLRAIGYVVKRRDDPTFTIEQAGDLVIKLDNLPDPPTPASA